MRVEKILQHLIGKTYSEVVANLSFDEGQGSCCGYASVDVEDHVAKLKDNESAILHDVVQIVYDEDDDARVVVNFIFNLGDHKGVILGYDLTAGSSSGFSYGAYCHLIYDKEVVAEVSW